jgi:hypothetical protein
MFIDATPIHPKGMFPLRWIVEEMKQLPGEIVRRIATNYVETQKKAEAAEGHDGRWTPSRVIERRIALAKRDEERLTTTLWAGLWTGQITASVLHLASCRCYATELSAWDPHLDAVRDLRESIIGGMFLGPIVSGGGGALLQELIRRPILVSGEAARHLARLTHVSESDLRKHAEWLVARQVTKSDGPMLKDDFVTVMRRHFGRRILIGRAEDAWGLYAPEEWKRRGRRKGRSGRS